MSEISAWIWSRLDADDKLSDDVKLLVLAAVEGEDLTSGKGGAFEPPQAPASTTHLEPAGAFLKSIIVQGFRGIGSSARLDLSPRPGLTIVAGRNGSGKSSFAEALEVALTGTTYRWRNKRSKQWQEAWRNIHESAEPHVEVAIAEEGVGTTKIVAEWSDEELESLAVSMQRKGEKKQAGIGSLGWDEALETFRPLLSYDELDGLFAAEPSKLYDAIATVLGLEQLSDALARLTEYSKGLNARSADITKRKKALSEELARLDDERAAKAELLLKARSLEAKALRDIATGAGVADPSVKGIERLRDLRYPSEESVKEAADVLGAAVAGMAEAGDAATTLLEMTAGIKSKALELHRHAGDIPCPVCQVGVLDETWVETTELEVAASKEHLAQLQAAKDRLLGARRDAQLLVAAMPDSLSRPTVEEVEPLRAAAVAAWRRWAEIPGDDVGLVRNLNECWAPLAAAMQELQSAAAEAVQVREDRWSPVALQLAGFVEVAEQWEKDKPAADDAKTALKWLKENDLRLKNERVKPIADSAAAIWDDLRQESNVSVGGLSLQGSANRRHVAIPATVDGEEAGALAVMSQGELHALALALFLPRATASESPFRFVVLDDPVQAMDPAKVDGLVTVLSRIAADRQVIVFSHDDRLSSAVRRAPVEAQIMEVKRGEGSSVTVTNTYDPPQRYLRDARALLKDERLPEETGRQVLPGLLRLALEAACRDRYFSSQLAAGESHAQVEDAWIDARTTSQRMWLAVRGTTQPDERWLDKLPRRKRALGICTSAFHQGLRGDLEEACRDVEALVADVREGVR